MEALISLHPWATVSYQQRINVINASYYRYNYTMLIFTSLYFGRRLHVTTL